MARHGSVGAGPRLAVEGGDSGDRPRTHPRLRAPGPRAPAAARHAVFAPRSRPRNGSVPVRRADLPTPADVRRLLPRCPGRRRRGAPARGLGAGRGARQGASVRGGSPPIPEGTVRDHYRVVARTERRVRRGGTHVRVYVVETTCCGERREVPGNHIHVQGRRTCLSCRDALRARRWTRRRCADCGAQFRLRRSQLTQRAVRCEDCAAERRRRTSRERARRLQTSARGRRCVGCRRTDAETRWSQCPARCSACDRAGWRHGWCGCGAPMWRGGRGPLRCRAGCEEGQG